MINREAFLCHKIQKTPKHEKRILFFICGNRASLRRKNDSAIKKCLSALSLLLLLPHFKSPLGPERVSSAGGHEGPCKHPERPEGSWKTEKVQRPVTFVCFSIRLCTCSQDRHNNTLCFLKRLKWSRLSQTYVSVSASLFVSNAFSAHVI